MLVIAIIVLPITVIVALARSGDSVGGAIGFMILGLLAAVLYGLVGWVFIPISYLLYNVAAGWVCGIEVQVEAVAPPTSAPAWGPSATPPPTAPPRPPARSRSRRHHGRSPDRRRDGQHLAPSPRSLMISRHPRSLRGVAVIAILVTACGTTPTGPVLTDATAIVTAALTSTEAAKSVHVDVTVDGIASVALPIGGGVATPLDLTGTTATADIDFAKPAARATFAVKAGLTVNGEVIAIDGKTYLKSTLTGSLYAQSAGSTPVDPSAVSGLIDNLGDLLLKPGTNLVKGNDVACGSKQCYSVSADLSAADLGNTGSGALDNLPVNLAGAALKLTIRVEKDLPYHLAGVSAVLSTPDGAMLTIDVIASKWDEPVAISAPPADQVKPAS